MAHGSVIDALKKLNKQTITTISLDEHSEHLKGESDRSFIVLHGSTAESFLSEKLKKAMPGLNSDETARMFGFNGAIGTFSNMITVAHGLGLMDRAMRYDYDLIREMRNVAAHALMPVDFGTKEIAAATISFLPNEYRQEARSFRSDTLRMIFGNVCISISNQLFGNVSGVTKRETLMSLMKSWEYAMAAKEKAEAAKS